MKRKYKQGDRVDSVAELLEHDWFIVRFGPRTTKTMHMTGRVEQLGGLNLIWY